MNLSALIMGAGLSSRLVGANKLLLDWLGKPILLHTVSNVLEAGFKETLLVLGNDKDKIKSALKEKLKVIFCIGETLNEKRRNKTNLVLKNQINLMLRYH